MDSAISSYCHHPSIEGVVYQKIISTLIVNFSPKNKRKMLRAFLLGHLHKLFIELFLDQLQGNQNNSTMEYYEMDSKIIQVLIQGIIETGEYTLEGIALYTRIPFDVIYDAACGINNQFSITPVSYTHLTLPTILRV